MRKRLALTCAAVVGGYALLVFAMYWPVWTRGQMSGWDCAVEYWPDLVFQVHAIGHGHLPMWNPYSLGGYPYWADPQTGMWHPASWLCWLAAAIGGNGPWLIQLKVWIGLCAAMSGMHGWTFSRTRSHFAGVVAAVTFVIGSPLLVHKNGAVLFPVLYWPWALWALERFVQSPTVRRGAILGAAVWLVGAAGHPQSFFYGLVVLALYWLFLTIAPDPRNAHRLALSQLLGAAIAIVVAGLLLAATWIPASAAVAESARAHRGLDYVLQQPLSPGELRELVVPNLDTDWMQDVYVGPLALVGGLWLLTTSRRRWAGFWIGVAGFGIVLALGAHAGVLTFFAKHVPGFDLFRIAYRHKLIFGVAAAALAGDSVATLERGEGSRWIWLGGIGVWILAAILIAFRPLELALSLATLGAAASLWWLKGKLRLAALGAIALLTIVDLWHAGESKLEILQRRPDVAKDLARAAPLDDTYRYDVGDMSSPYGGTIPYWTAYLGPRREESGYLNPIEPQRHIELEAFAKKQPLVLAQVGVKYFAGWKVAIAGTPVAPRITAIDDVAPIARWYGRAEIVAHDQVLARMAASPPSQTTAAYVEADDVQGIALPSSDNPPVDARLVSYDDDEIAIDVDAPAAGIVVLAEQWAPGWTAEVNGDDARVFRADYLLRAVQVPEGTSRVIFRYRPTGRVAWPLAFLLGLAALGVAAFGRWRWLDRAAPMS